MTCILTVVQPDRVHILADSVAYDHDGEVIAFVHKIIPVPRANAVFTVRGDADGIAILYGACLQTPYEGFDGFVAKWDDIFELFKAGAGDRLHEPGGYELLVTGWSDRLARGIGVFCITRPGYPWATPCVPYLLAGANGFGIWPDDKPEPLSFDPIRDGIAIFENARRLKWEMPGKGGAPVMRHYVGGGVLHAMIQPGKPLEAEWIHRWPQDVVGQAIEADVDAR